MKFVEFTGKHNGRPKLVTFAINPFRVQYIDVHNESTIIVFSDDDWFVTKEPYATVKKLLEGAEA